MTKPAVRNQAGPAWQPTELVSTLLSRGAREVVRYWISHGQFLDDNHQPRSLAFTGSGHSDFNSLVRQVSQHLAPAIIQSELLRKGIVEQHENGGLLLLRRSAYIPDTGCEEDQALAVREPQVSGDVFRRRQNDVI